MISKSIEWLKVLVFIGSFSVFFISLTVHAASPSQTDQQANFSLEYYYDKASSMNIDDVINQQFIGIPNQFALGYRSGTAWLKVTVENNSDIENYVLAFSEAFWSQLDFYNNDQGKWQIQENGLNIPVKERRIKTSIPAFSLFVQSGEKKVFYIKGITVSSHIGKFTLYPEVEFFRPDRFTLVDMFNIYSGVLLFIMLLVSFLYFTVREKVYFFYICYVLSFITWISVHSGTYLNLGLPGWDDALHALGTLVVLFLILFSNEILQLKEKNFFANKIFKSSAAIVLIFGVAITMQIPGINLVFNLFSSLFFIFFVVTAVKAWRNQYFKDAHYYLVALLIYIPSMGVMTMTYNGLLQNFDITRYAFTFGSLIEILCFSFILVSKYGEEKFRRLSAENQLKQQRENYAHELEEQVDKRTRELDEANKKLMKQARLLEEAKQQLSIEAKTDTLSGLLNRRYFLKFADSLFHSAEEIGQTISVLMMDIDRFKGINDNFGHHAGDEVIKACALIFQDSLRIDDIVGRYGGEEFVLLLPGIAGSTACDIAEKIRKEIETRPVKYEDAEIHMTLSIGVTEIVPDSDKSIEDMLQRADQALYKAKEKGRNHVVCL